VGVASNKNLTLAEELRPASWDDFVGLDGIDRAFIGRIRSGGLPIPSAILWGPPGCGKTTLAKLIGASYSCHFEEFSAVLNGVKEVRDLVMRAADSSKPTLLFVDEIHRFNKAQQDAFLPHVERGTIALIGATTENPSFSINSALLSRMKVVVLPALSESSMNRLIDRACASRNISMSAEARARLIAAVVGDGRQLNNILGEVSLLGQSAIEASHIEDYLGRRFIMHDRDGDEHYGVASAFIKSLRGSDPDAALFWGLRLIQAGEDIRFVCRRMIAFAAEDIGNADPRALMLAVSTLQAAEAIGMPEARIPIAQCITYLACSPKSNRSYIAMLAAWEANERHSSIRVPNHLMNAPTKLAKQLGRGKEYKYPHDYPGAFVPGETYLPDELKGVEWYNPSDRGAEEVLAKRLKAQGQRS
jgi:putative ATPase